MRFFYYPLFLSLVACSQLVTPPKKLLSESDMEAIFYDLAILNAAKNIDAFSFEKKGVDVPSIIYKKYKIDSLELAQNISYYSSNIEECRKILKKVELRLKEEDSLLQQQTPLQPPPPQELSSDSLK